VHTLLPDKLQAWNSEDLLGTELDVRWQQRTRCYGVILPCLSCFQQPNCMEYRSKTCTTLWVSHLAGRILAVVMKALVDPFNIMSQWLLNISACLWCVYLDLGSWAQLGRNKSVLYHDLFNLWISPLLSLGFPFFHVIESLSVCPFMVLRSPLGKISSLA